MRAAKSLKLDPVQVFDIPENLVRQDSDQLSIDFRDLDQSSAWIETYHQRYPLDAVVSVDDSATELASHAAARIGLPANDPIAARAARDKFLMRNELRKSGVKCPEFQLLSADDDPAEVALSLEYPVVIKPRRLSGSRGVIRANTPEEFRQALDRVRHIIAEAGEGEASSTILIESYLPGDEVAVEGLMTEGRLQVLAIFDKPDPLVGPFFEETIYTTPSRKPRKLQEAIEQETARAARALGLEHGPIHAELRIDSEHAWILEIAGRSIGGL